jgi:hypothetical protein
MIGDGVFYLTNLCGVQDKCIYFYFVHLYDTHDLDVLCTLPIQCGAHDLDVLCTLPIQCGAHDICNT